MLQILNARHHELNAFCRSVVIAWMVEVNRDYNFADVTLHASVRILDLFLLRIEYVSHLNLSAAVWNFQSKRVEFYSFSNIERCSLLRSMLSKALSITLRKLLTV